MEATTLPPGVHAYEEILQACHQGRYRFGSVRSRSGRLHRLIGLTGPELALIRSEAKKRGVGVALLGSRVVGPRSRQRALHPLLSGVPLESRRREPSATYPPVGGVVIDKTAIKELGHDDPRTSDLSLVLIDRKQLATTSFFRVAVQLEERLRELGKPYPVRVYSQIFGRQLRSLKDLEDVLLIPYIRQGLPPGAAPSEKELREAARELYATLNLPQAPLGWRDVFNGVVVATTASVSFGLALGFHDVLPLAGFGFGLLGRHLSRLRAWVAHSGGDDWKSNGAALGVDAAIGFGVMALVINPAAGYGIPLWALASNCFANTMSRGSVRLFMDKVFSTRREWSQAKGVLLTALLNLGQGLVTSFVYAGSPVALLVQAVSSGFGFWLVFVRRSRPGF